MSAAAALGDTANQIVSAIVEEEDKEENRQEKEPPEEKEKHSESNEGSLAINPEEVCAKLSIHCNTHKLNMIVQESEESGAGELLEKSIWDAVSYLGNAIQTSTLYDGFTKCRLHSCLR